MKVGLQLPPSEGPKVSALQAHVENSTKIANGSGFAEGEFISNSYLSGLKALLLGVNKFYGSQDNFDFGVEFHYRLKHLGKKKERTFRDELEKKLQTMVKITLAHPLVKKLLKNSIREEIIVKVIGGQSIKVILDVKTVQGNKRIALDYKTTSAKTQAEFERSILKYDYPRQAYIYTTAEKIDEFIFFGISKHEPHPVFIVNMMDDEHKHLLVVGCQEYNLLVNVHNTLKRYYASLKS